MISRTILDVLRVKQGLSVMVKGETELPISTALSGVIERKGGEVLPVTVSRDLVMGARPSDLDFFHIHDAVPVSAGDTLTIKAASK